MELKLVDGRYVSNGRGVPQSVGSTEELLERASLRLCARRGGFAPMPSFGSRLHLLPREKKSARKTAAELYVAEALAEETQLKIAAVTVEENGDALNVRVDIEHAEGSAVLSVNVKE